MVNTRTLRDYMASFQPTPNNEGTLVTANLETVTSAAFLTEVSVPSNIVASGIPSNATYLRGDGVWAVPPGSSGGVDTIQEGTGIDVDATDPSNPIVSIQSGYLAAVATTGSYNDLDDIPSLGSLAEKNAISVPGDITTTGTPSSTTFLRGDGVWATPPGGGGGGGQVDSVVAGDGISVDDTDPVNPIVSIESGYLATVATSGSYDDLDDLPTLGSLAALNTIDNGNWSGTDLSVANGGTGASDASGARTNLGLVIGTNVQAYSANLNSWSSVTRATGFDAFAATPSSANLRALLTDEVGTGSAYFVGGALGTPASVNLTNGTSLPLSTGVTGTLPLSNGGTGATDAAGARSSLGLVIGTNVQEYDVNTAKTNVAQSWTAAQLFGRTANSIATTSGTAFNNANGNIHTRTVSANVTYTVSNVPSSSEFSMYILITYTSGTITWFSGVNWVGGAAPAFETGKTYEVIMTTLNGGTSWRAVSGSYAA